MNQSRNNTDRNHTDSNKADGLTSQDARRSQVEPDLVDAVVITGGAATAELSRVVLARLVAVIVGVHSLV